jgi:DNA invertase Pin-like site-specific DNA recombinase
MGEEGRRQEGKAVTPRVAIYRRISTNRQDTKSQTRAIFDWLKGQGLRRRDVLWFTDRGFSSALVSRPALDRMMELVTTRGLDRIVVWKLDRIGRWDSDDFLAWRIAVKRAKVELVSLTEQAMGFETLAEKIIALVIAEADKLWLDGHRKRVAAGIRAKRKPGQAWGGAITTAKDGRKVDRRGDGRGRAPAPREEIEKACEEIRSGRTRVATVARAFGVDERSVRRWLARYTPAQR